MYSVVYFSLDWVEICTEHPRNPKDHLQHVFMEKSLNIFLPRQRIFNFQKLIYPLVFTFMQPNVLCSINIVLSHLDDIWSCIKNLNAADLAKYSFKAEKPTFLKTF